MATEKQSRAAIERLPTQSTKQIKQVRENAQRVGASEVVAACDRELRGRGTLDLTAEQAAAANEQAVRMQGKPLYDVILAAFTEIPARDYERHLISQIYEQAGRKFQEIERAYGKRDASLTAGHLVYDRFGFFRQFLDSERDQSSILLVKGKQDGQVTWALKDETQRAFKKLGLLDC